MNEPSTAFDYFHSGGHLILGQSPDGPDRVEAMLSGLWARAKNNDPDCRSVYRLSLANLVLVACEDNSASLEQFGEFFAGHHPSRVLMVAADAGTEDLTASLSASCRKNPSGEGVICWEKITLRYPPGQDRRMASAVRSLLVGRIATVVVLGTAACGCHELARQAVDWADLLVTDCHEFSIVADLVYWDSRGSRASRTNWMDRGWRALEPLRRVIASAYSGADIRGRFATAVDITCAGTDPAQCHLLAGWLATRLDWRILRALPSGGIVFRRADSEDRVTIHFADEKEPSVCLMGCDSCEDVLLRLPREGSSTDRVDWGNPDWAAGVVDALHTSGPDSVFLSAADAAARMERVLAGSAAGPAVVVAGDSSHLAQQAAERFTTLALDAVAKRGRFRVALAGGRTPEALYSCLAGTGFRDRFPWDRTDWFWGDERWVPPGHPDSNYRMAKTALLDHVPVIADRVHPIPTDADTPLEAAERYESVIRDTWGRSDSSVPSFDLILLGLGGDGHTASWFPGTDLDASSWRLVWGGYVDVLDTERISLTPAVLNAARRVMFLVSGAGKADIVARSLYPPWRERHPAARLEPHAGVVEWHIDSEAAMGIVPADFVPVS